MRGYIIFEMKTEQYLDSTFLTLFNDFDGNKIEFENKIIQLVQDAIEYNFKLVMIRSNYLELAKKIIEKHKSDVLLGTVVDFPLGTSSTQLKLTEALKSIKLGTNELDFVCDYNSFKQKRFKKFDNDIISCTKLSLENNNDVKWIIETGALSDDEVKNICSRISLLINNNFASSLKKIFLKTSTGYYGGFGATIEDIKLMKTWSKGMLIKASGGISNYFQFKKMLESGADRVGTSNAVNIFLKK